MYYYNKNVFFVSYAIHHFWDIKNASTFNLNIFSGRIEDLIGNKVLKVKNTICNCSIKILYIICTYYYSLKTIDN